MGLFSTIIGAPLAPLRGTVWVAEQVLEAAENQHYDPGTIRRGLEEIADAREAGVLSESEADQMERELVRRLLESTRRRNRKETR